MQPVFIIFQPPFVYNIGFQDGEKISALPESILDQGIECGQDGHDCRKKAFVEGLVPLFGKSIDLVGLGITDIRVFRSDLLIASQEFPFPVTEPEVVLFFVAVMLIGVSETCQHVARPDDIRDPPDASFRRG